MRAWYNPLVNILHFGPDIQGTSGAGGGGSSPPTGTTGYLKRPGYVIGGLPIQTPNLARKIFGTAGGGGGGGSPPTGTTGYLKRAGYVIGTLPIQTPDLARRIFGTVGGVVPTPPPQEHIWPWWGPGKWRRGQETEQERRARLYSGLVAEFGAAVDGRQPREVAKAAQKIKRHAAKVVPPFLYEELPLSELYRKLEAGSDLAHLGEALSIAKDIEQEILFRLRDDEDAVLALLLAV